MDWFKPGQINVRQNLVHPRCLTPLRMRAFGELWALCAQRFWITPFLHHSSLLASSRPSSLMSWLTGIHTIHTMLERSPNPLLARNFVCLLNFNEYLIGCADKGLYHQLWWTGLALSKLMVLHWFMQHKRADLELKERAEIFFLGRKLEKKESHCDLSYGNHSVLPARERWLL